jgi:hypothetical protein
MTPRGLISLLLAAGAAVLLGAARSRPARPSLPPNTECQDWWASEADPDASHDGMGGETVHRILRLVRNKNYASLDLSRGAFVGGMENTHSSQGSATYPNLKSKEKGCIWMKRYISSTGEEVYDGYFYHYKGGRPVQLLYALKCEHGRDGNPDKKPIWVPIPDDGKCETYKMTVGTVSVTLPAIEGKAFTTQTLFPRLRIELIKAGLSPAQAAAAVARAAGSGPWYPCEANGCCRAT